MPTVHFAHSLLYGANVTTGVRTGVGSRAYAWIKIINPANGMASRRLFGLIDSGCDDCFLDSGLLKGLGLATSPSSVTVAGGSPVSVDVANNADIEIEGVVVSGRPLTFGAATTSLIGRDIYLRAFELGFRGSDWLHAQVDSRLDRMPLPELGHLENVIATPHIGGLTPPASESQAFDTVRQVEALVKGEVPPGAANLEDWTRRV